MWCWKQGLRAAVGPPTWKNQEVKQDKTISCWRCFECFVHLWGDGQPQKDPPNLNDLTWQNEKNGEKKWNAELRMSGYKLSFKIFLGHGRVVFWRCAVASKRLAWEREQRLLLFDGRAPSGKSSENVCCLWGEHGHIIFYRCLEVMDLGELHVAEGSCEQHPVDISAFYLKYVVSSAKKPNSFGIGISLAQSQQPSYWRTWRSWIKEYIRAFFCIFLPWNHFS